MLKIVDQTSGLGFTWMRRPTTNAFISQTVKRVTSIKLATHDLAAVPNAGTSVRSNEEYKLASGTDAFGGFAELFYESTAQYMVDLSLSQLLLLTRMPRFTSRICGPSQSVSI